MGLVDRLRELDAPVQIALLAGVAVVGLVVVVVLVVVAAIVGTFVLGLGSSGDVGTQVTAGASVSEDPETGQVAVTFTSNRDADYLRASWRSDPGELSVAGTEGDVDVGATSARLNAVGSRLVLAEPDGADETTVSVTVTAVGGDDQSVVLSTEVTV